MSENKHSPIRVAVFASFDTKHIIHDYVITYIQRLREVCDKIIFIADNDAPETEQNKIANLVDFYQFKRHGEYDFGSYKIGWKHLKKEPWFNNIDEVIFCNDSCFTISPLKPVFNEMDAHSCDFWGMTESDVFKRHLQSFFLVFKKKVLHSPLFDNFFCSITKQNTFEDIVHNYEIPIESMLEEAGFISDAFVKGVSSPHQRPLTLIKMHCPLIKKKNFVIRLLSYEGHSIEGVTGVLQKIKTSSPKDYEEILSYYQKSPLRIIISYSIKFYIRQFFRFFYQKKTTSKGNLLIKICKIPVFHIKKQTQDYLTLIIKKEKQQLQYLTHKISKSDYKDKRKTLKEQMLLQKATLGVAYNIFDGEELLEDSIKSIRSVAFYVVVIWQKISNYGEKANPDLETLLIRLKKQGLIDKLYLYEPKLNHPDKHYNEKLKRDIGLQLVKKAGCNYFLSMDTDEFYHAHQIKSALKYIAENKINSSAVSIIEYLKEPTYQIINGYSFSPKEYQQDYTFYVPFIMKIHRFKKQNHSDKDFPCLIDPTRGLNPLEKFYLFPKHIVAMHHFSTIRKDLAKKYHNSNLQYQNKKQDLIELLQNQILSYEYENNLVELSSFNELYIKKVPNVFNINIRGDKKK